MKCPRCGKKLISNIEGSSIIFKCCNCDYVIVTSNIDKILEDETIYTIFVEKNDIINNNMFKTISKIKNCNFLEAKKLLESGRFILLKGLAREIDGVVHKLIENNISFNIEPEYTYIKN